MQHLNGKNELMARRMKAETVETAHHGRLLIKAVPPFDFELSFRIFGGGDDQIQIFKDGEFKQVVRADDRLVLITVRPAGTSEQPALTVEFLSAEALTPGSRQSLRRLIEHMFNLPLDLKPFYAAMRKDPVLSVITRKLQGLKNPATETPLEALVSSIIEQQISLRVAWSMQTKVIKKFGDRLEAEEKTYFAFPTPAQLAGATVRQLRDCGLSNRKAEYIIGVSQLVAEGKLDLDELVHRPAEQVIEKMISVRGIGRWTAEMTMIRGMHRPDVFPADDLGLRRLIGHYYNEDMPVSSEEARAIAEPWGQWKGLAAYYLIVAWISGIDV